MEHPALLSERKEKKQLDSETEIFRAQCKWLESSENVSFYVNELSVRDFPFSSSPVSLHTNTKSKAEFESFCHKFLRFSLFYASFSLFLQLHAMGLSPISPLSHFSDRSAAVFPRINREISPQTSYRDEIPSHIKLENFVQNFWAKQDEWELESSRWKIGKFLALSLERKDEKLCDATVSGSLKSTCFFLGGRVARGRGVDSKSVSLICPLLCLESLLKSKPA